MSRRAAATFFIGIAAFLYAARYITAAIFGSNIQTWNSDLFRAMLQNVGSSLHTWALVALVIGAIYLVWAEMTERSARGG